MTTLTEERTAPRTAPAPEPVLQAAVDKSREYVVLRSTDEDATWYVVGVFAASSGDDAVRTAAAREAANEEIDTSGTLRYVAVPARSFQPVELTARVEPKIEFKR
jgi:hypothetical protein